MAAESLQALGAINEGKSAKIAGDYNAQVAEQNAIYSRQQSIEEERRQRIQARKFIGDMRANYGASGVTLEGSPLDILQESAANAELDALTIRAGGEAKASQYQNEAQVQRISGKNALKSSKLKAAGYLFKGGETLASYGGGGAK